MKIRYRNIVELINARSNSSKAIAFIKNRENETEVSFRELIKSSKKLAATLISSGFQAGDETVLQISENRNFVEALLSCFLTGIVPVIVNPVKDSESAKKLNNVISTLNRPAILCDKESYRAISVLDQNFEKNRENIKLYVIGDRKGDAEEVNISEPAPDATAFIQFSSGSTGDPKGVIVSHRNLIHNIAAMLEAIDCDEDEVFLSWAPLTHSSGMILSLLNALAGDFDLYLMDKQAFIADPVFWLEKANQIRATLIFSPNFGYKYFLDAFDEQKNFGWNLSCVKHVLNGSEQISSALSDKFNKALSKFKLSHLAMTPIYGLAESTLAVSVGDRDRGMDTIFVNREKLNVGDKIEVYGDEIKEKAIELVKLGKPVPGTKLRMVDDSGNILPVGYVGTLQVKSDSVVVGYFNNPSETKSLITHDGWLNTGDLAFIYDGELVIAGKTKEVIIVNGVNHYPVDLERIAAQALDEDFSKFVASSYYDGEKQKEIVVLGCVYSGSLESFYQLSNKIKSEILKRVGIEIDFIIPIEEIPHTSSGKIQRKEFAKSFRNTEYAEIISKIISLEKESRIKPGKRKIPEIVKKTAEEILGQSVDSSTGLVAQGFNSVMSVAYRNRLSQIFGFDLPVSLVFDYINVKDIAGFIQSEIFKPTESALDIRKSRTFRSDEPIAIVGVGLRFPGNIDDIEKLWRSLSEGVDLIRNIPESRWTLDNYNSMAQKERIREIPSYGAYLDDVGMFDNRFFGISPKETESMDPQHRLLLETSYRAFEDAGIKTGDIFGSDAGVFIGLANSDYMQAEVKSGKIEDINIFSLTGSAPCTAAGRLSYFYGFHGPSVVVDSACSSSFSALHSAVKSLQYGEIPLALVGAANLILSPEFHIGLNEMGVLSPDGRCKTFDESANGYVRSEGCATLILKRLSDAVANGDNIHGVILGSAVNHDGRSAGLASPNGKAQIDVMEKALAASNLKPADIDYFEAHGTGTAIGDVQEINSISRVYSERDNDLLLGSVKSNIGHLEACSGFAGLLKILVAFKKRIVPGNLHFRKPNPNINWDKTKLKIVSKNIELPKNKKLRASINSFGFSGTNVNIIVEEAPERIENINNNELQKAGYSHNALPITAQTPNSLLELCDSYLSLINDNNYKEIIAAASSRRSDLSERLVAIGRNSEEIKRNLRAYFEGGTSVGLRVSSFSPSAVGSDIVFQFSGGGSQRSQMGKELYECSSIFRENFDKCAVEFDKYSSISIVESLFREKPLPENLEYAHPYLFAFEYSLAQLWISWEIKPTAVIGHSIGEYAAACLAGIFSLEAACKLVANRARLMESVNGNGLMCAVFADELTVMKHLNGASDKVDAAVINSEENIVISGERESILAVIEKLQESDIETKILKVPLASHSRMMQPILDDYNKIVNEVELCEPACVYMSNMTGRPVGSGEVTKPRYWVDQIRSCVRYGDSLKRLVEDNYRIFLEIGPSPVLSGIGIQAYPDLEALWLPSLDKNTTEWEQLLICAAELYVNHYSIDWNTILDLPRASWLDLPAYPFERRYFWKNPLVISGSDPKCGSAQNFSSKSIIERKHNGVKKMDVIGDLKNMIFDLTGNRLSDSDNDKLIFQLGLDSLILVKLRQGVKRKFDVDISMSKIFKELNTLQKISAHIKANAKLPQIVEAPNEKMLEYSEATINAVVPIDNNFNFNGDESLIAGIFKEQFNIMNRQLDLLKQGVSVNTVHVPTSSNVESKKANRPAPVNFRSVKLDSDDKLSPSQKKYIDDLISQYNRKTKKSREYAQKYRFPLSDWINTLSYRHELKKMSYPFVSERAEGCRVIDIDGNEYVDLANGYGVHFFGHKPGFIFDAINKEISAGCAIGPQSKLVGETAELLCEITGNERVTFCNTGTEAVMVAIRLARAKTGRDKIVIFSGSYHGTYDGVLAIADDNSEIQPVSIGVLDNMVKDVVVLEYGSDMSLDYIDKNGAELAAVICEPVQSRKPSLQPIEFLKKLRTITSKNGSVLIFDEIVTGFRISPGGCQESFDVRADIVTYGKIAGGGMPIGIVSGNAEYLDMIDGGFWSFDDDSSPSSDITFFGGTFCKHPFAMAACNAVMKKIKSEGSALYERINALTSEFVEKINNLFKRESIPFTCSHFASQFRIDGLGVYSAALKPIELDLFFYSMVNKGVYFWERKINFFSVEITSKETEYILRSAEETLREMKAAGFFHNDGDTGACVLSSDSVTFPVTSAQKRMYILGQYEHGELAYHITIPFILQGKPDFYKLENAFRAVIQRHDSLRSAFYTNNGVFLQEIKNEFDFHLIRIDRLSDEDLHNTVRKFMKPFDFAAPPLLRAGYCELEDKKSLLVIDVHHIVVDGISLGILFKELSAYYNGETISELPASPKALSQDEIEYLKSDEYASSKRFLLDKYSGELPTFELPATGMRKNTHNFSGDQLHFLADRELTAALKKLAGELNVTLYSVLLGIFYIFLSKMTKKEDLIIGIPVSSRPDDGQFDNLIGMAANTIPLRCAPRNELAAHDFLREMQTEIFAAQEHNRFPLEELAEALGITRQPDRNPLFDILFVFENAEKRELDLGGIPAERFKYVKRTTMSDLVLEAIYENDTIYLSVEYDDNLFNSQIIKTFSEYYLNTLKSITEKNERIRDIKITPKAAEEKLASGLASYSIPVKYNSIVEAFAQSVEKNYDKTAIISENKKYTYLELNTRADEIADIILKKFNPQKGEIAALFLERNFDLAASIIAVLKCGMAYLPLNKDYPIERISRLLNASGASLVITDESIDWSENKVVISGSDVSAEATFLKSSLSGATKKIDEIECNREDLAYLYFTSGSTGEPKGVMINHNNILAFKENFSPIWGLTECDLIYAITPITFDISNLEILCSLLHGMTVVLGTEEDINNIDLFSETIERYGVSALQITPSRLSLVVNEIGTEFLDKLKTALVGGEELPKSLHEQLLTVKNVNIYNVYGPTETTIWSTSKKLTDNPSSIGTPLVNESVFVLDEDLNIQPLYVPGEIYIGGAGVGAGYWKNVELTDRAFIRTSISSGILYKTGDLGRINAEFELEFIGRNDNQVKINGLRIELNEIEACADSFKDVEKSVCIVKRDGDAKYLVLFYTGRGVNSVELNKYLSARLPQYMVPNIFQRIDNIPLSPNGKISRKELENIRSGSKLKKDIIAPNNENERILASVLRKVLCVEEISLDSNFFEIGGDSIKAIQLISGLYREGKSLELKDALRHPILAEMAAYLHVEGDSVVTLESDKLTPLQEAMYYANVGKSNFLYHEQLSFEIIGDLSQEIYEKAWQEIVERHDVFKSNYETDDFGEVRRVYKKREPFKLIYPTIEENQEFNKNDLLSQDLSNTFDLESERLIRIYLVKTGERRYFTLISFHHIILDGWSHGLIFEELRSIYRALENNSDATLGPAFQFQSYSSWLALRDKTADREFWTGYLNGFEPYPHNFEQGQEPVITETDFTLSRIETENFLEYAKKLGATPSAVIAASWGAALARRLNKCDVVFGVTLSGRQAPLAHIEHGVGMFINTVPIRLNFGKNSTEAIIQTNHRNLIDINRFGFYSLDEIRRDCGFDNAIIDHVLVIENYKLTELSIADNLNVQNVAFRERTDFGLTVYITLGDRIDVKAVYDGSDEARRFTVTELIKDFARNLDISVLETGFQLEYDKTETNYSAIAQENTVRRTLGGRESTASSEIFQKELIEIFTGILEKKDTDFNTNFFESGGHSLKAIKLISAIYKRYGIKLVFNDVLLNPTIKELSQVLALKREARAPQIEETQPKEYYELSYAQKRLWLIDNKQGNSRAYNVCGSLRLEGDLSVDAFSETMSILVNRHDAFRTSFRKVGGEPKLFVEKEISFAIDIIDFSSTDDPNESARNFVTANSVTDFDLTKAPLIKVSLLYLGAQNSQYVYVLFFKAHHIIFDGWSNEILLKEISRVYNSIINRQTPHLEKLPPDCAGYVEKLNASDDVNNYRDYWLKKMSDFSGNLPMPTDYARTGLPVYDGDSYVIAVDKNLIESLRKIDNSLKCSLFDIIAASVYVLLYIESSQKDITVGIPLSGRTEPEIANVVGYFINTMPLRISVNGKYSIKELICDIRDNLTSMNANQAYPFDKLIEDMDLRYGGANSPMFDIIINSYSADLDALEIEGIRASVFTENAFFSKYDIQFYYEEKEEINIIIEYKTALFKRETIERFADALNAILREISNDETIAVDEIRQRMKGKERLQEEEDFKKSLLSLSEEF